MNTRRFVRSKCGVFRVLQELTEPHPKEQPKTAWNCAAPFFQEQMGTEQHPSVVTVSTQQKILGFVV